MFDPNMKNLVKPNWIKYECDTEGYIIYFKNQYDAAKFLKMDIQRFNYFIYYKKGVINSVPYKDEYRNYVFTNDTIYRIYEKPDYCEFNKKYYDNMRNKVVRDEYKYEDDYFEDDGFIDSKETSRMNTINERNDK